MVFENGAFHPGKIIRSPKINPNIKTLGTIVNNKALLRCVVPHIIFCMFKINIIL